MSSIVAVSVDMEGVSQLCGVREIFGCAPEYWVTGKPRLEADVKAACEGLLAGGASELVVLDNHGGNTINVSPEALPPGARLETWNVYDLRGPVPRRAALGRDARRCDRSSRSRRMGGTRSAPLQRSACENGAPPVAPPTAGTFEASMPNGSDVAEELGAAGWQRVGEVEFAIELEAWPDSREPLAAAMNAALSPFLPYWVSGFASADDARAADQERVAALLAILDAWANESQPQWYTTTTDPFPAGVAGRA